MSKLTKLSLDDLYARKVTSTVEAVIIEKDDFSVISNRWCEKVCRLACRAPNNELLRHDHVDVMILQDYRAFDEPRFKKSGSNTELKHKELIKEFVDINFKDHSYGVFEVLKCSIQQLDLKKGKAPTDITQLKCRPYLLEEINRVKPKVIISLSTTATKALGLKKSNYGNLGEITEYNGIPVVITLHPRILLMLRQNSSGKYWGPDFYSVINNDFNKVGKLLKGELRVPKLDEAIEKAKQQIRIARSLDEVREFCQELIEIGENGGILSYDTETTGVDPFAEDAKIITMQFGFRNEETGSIEAIVFPMWHRENQWYDPNEAWKLIKPILEREDIKLIGHNIKFDILYTTKTTGTRPVGIFLDTMLLMHALNSGLQGTYSLKQAVWDWLPELELGGYEDKLPKLSKIKDIQEEELEDES
jgi:hypothetical protein